MRVLIACEFSGRVRDAFIERGHDAWSCDLMAGRGSRHFKGDVSPVLKREWDLVIAHPPCTYITNASSCRLTRKKPQQRVERLLKMLEAVEFFKSCLLASAKYVCVENPIPHGYAMERIGLKYSQIVQPYEFGDPESKATCLWLKNLPLLVPTDLVQPSGIPLVDRRVVKHPYGIGRMRSITYQGIANAMADQWGSLDV